MKKKGENTMDLLYTTTMKYTFEEYKKFNMAVIKKTVKRMGIILLLLILIAVLKWIAEPFNNVSLFLIAFVVIYPILYYIEINAGIKKAYNSNELLKDIESIIEFYEDYFVAKTDKSREKVEYDKLYEILENKTNFYIMIGNNQGYLVLKANCSQELIEFILKLKNRRKNKK